MAEHIVSLSFSIDDNVIERLLEKNAYNDILKSIRSEMIRQLPTKYYHSAGSERDVNWREIANRVIAEFVSEHKDEVIEAASKEVAASIKKSKKYREAVEESARLVVDE